MDAEPEVIPLHCPACHALVVDRRHARCTTCAEALPAGWLLSPDQVRKIEEINAHATKEHATFLHEVDVPINHETDLKLREPMSDEV